MAQNKGGRPRKEIDKTAFESLLKLQCTLDEVTGFFDDTLNGCSADTIERWCKRTYGESFADVSKKKRAHGKISLRRYQFELAKKYPAMAIWLGKNYLGQTDQPIIEGPIDAAAEDELSRSLREMAEGLESDE